MVASMLLVVLTAISGLAAAPTELLGQQPGSAYSAFVEQQVRADRARVVGPSCAGLTLTALPRDRVGGNYIPPDIVADSATGTAMIEHVRASGCGRISRHNILIYRQHSGGWRAIALLPGASLASPTLQRDTLSTATRAITQLSTDIPCPPGSTLPQRLRVGEIVMVTPPARGGTWVERIPIRYCGVDRSMQVTYTPTPDGAADYALRPLFAMPRQ